MYSVDTLCRGLAVALLLGASAQGQSLSDFDNDIPNAPPSLGGPHEPALAEIPPGGTIEVHNSSLGLATRPVLVSDDDGEACFLVWSFVPVDSGTIRVEANVSPGDVMDGLFLELRQGHAARARIYLNHVMQVSTAGVVLASYSKAQPFRIRVDADLDVDEFSITVDPELDGFADNTTFVGFPLMNSGLTSVSNLALGLEQTMTPVPDAGVAFDDVYIGPQTIGSRYCDPAVPNSTGAPARLEAVGSLLAAQNFLELEAYDLPPDVLGYFIVSPTPSFVPNVGGGQGTLCLGGPLGRFRRQAQRSGAGGTMGIQVDLTDVPQLGAIIGGDTYAFQCWYRDTNPDSTSNLTDAVAIPFQ